MQEIMLSWLYRSTDKLFNLLRLKRLETITTQPISTRALERTTEEVV